MLLYRCAAGSAKAGLGNATCAACAACAADAYADADGTAACLTCAGNASAEEGATECFCDAEHSFPVYIRLLCLKQNS